MFKYLSSLFFALALLCAAQAPAQTATPVFKHYVGESGRPLKNGMQQVAEYEYDVYVNTSMANYTTKDGKKYIALRLPMASFNVYQNLYSTKPYTLGSQRQYRGSTLEPLGYYRWYDYTTDKAAANVVKYASSANVLASMNNEAGESAGLFAYNMDLGGGLNINGPCLELCGVGYNPPAESDNADWAGQTIACDVSRYVDYNSTTASDPFEHEPTLSVRYIFHIHSTATLAQNIKKALLNTEDGSDKAFEDYKQVSFGAKDNNSTVNLRLKLPDVSDYWFYPMNNYMSHHVFATADDHKIVESDFTSTTPVRATKISFREYDPSLQYYRQISNDANYRLDVSLNALNNKSWADLNGNTGVTAPTIKKGDKVYLVALANDGTSYCPIACWTLTIGSDYLKTAQQIADGNLIHRTSEYLESHYTHIPTITFDNDNDALTEAMPTSPSDNLSSKPSVFVRRSYGYVYPSLIDKSWMKDSYNAVSKSSRISRNPQFSPLHGEYGIYKSANFTNGSTIVSTRDVAGTDDRYNAKSSYTWYYAHRNNNSGVDKSGVVVFDRTHERDNSRYGSFLYVDASDESREIGYEEFEATLCSGSEMVVSAWIADMTSRWNDEETRPEVKFYIYGINKDEEGNVQDKKLFGVIASGDSKLNSDDKEKKKGGNINPDIIRGQWYNVFGRLKLASNLGAENYTWVRVTIQNSCKSTNGADYAVDDIDLYYKTAKLTVTQNKPICPDENTAGETASADKRVTLKITSDYNTLLETAGTHRKLFYRFYCNDDQSAVTGPDFYGSGADKYGTVTIPDSYNADATLGTEDNSNKQFETNSYGEYLLVLCNRYFALNPNKKYYVQLALPSDDADTTPDTWGSSQNGCSVYSSEFSLVQQNVVITNGSGAISTSVKVACDKDEVTDYSIAASLTTSDVENGGTIKFSSQPFDWYVGSRSDFNKVENLAEALKAFRTAYPNATSYDQPVTGVYTETYKNVLAANIYDAAHTSGKLLLSANTSLSGYPFKVGTYTVSAIPMKSSATIGNYTYEFCSDPMEFTVRSIKQGVDLALGMPNVIYPASTSSSSYSYRTIRVGLPQLKAMNEVTSGCLRVPIQSRSVNQSVSTTADLKFVGDDNSTASKQLILSDTNDPTLKFQVGTLALGELLSSDLSHDKTTLDFHIPADNVSKLHEGYYYELELRFITTNNTDATVLKCPGQTYFRLKVVPEYLTWTPTVNSNWNQDANWMRSTAKDLYKNDYTDYGTASLTGGTVDENVTRQSTYVPMYFTKVTIPKLAIGYYPTLGFISYSTVNGLALSLANDKTQPAQAGIAYEMEAKKPETDGIYDCQNFHGNVCEQIYFKPGAEMRSQQYLQYEKAWVDMEMTVNVWNTLSAPLKDVVAGDFYVPFSTGRQQTEAFTDITYNTTDNSRVKYPFYQRSWGESNSEETTTGGTTYPAWDSPESLLPAEGVDVTSTGWSHVYNKVDKSYSSASQTDNAGFSVKAGDSYLPNNESVRTSKALVRLPKADTQYSYYAITDGKTDLQTITLSARDSLYRLKVNPDMADGSLAQIKYTPSAVKPTDNNFYLVGNPYTASISVSRFLANNTSALSEQKVWVLRDNNIYEMPSTTSVSEQTDVIKPTESFFVKMADGAQNITFSKTQQVDPLMATGTMLVAAAKPNYITYTLDRKGTTNIDDISVALQVRAWSPEHNVLVVSNESGKSIRTIEVIDVTGKIWHVLHPKAKGTWRVNVPSGVYVVRTTFEQNGKGGICKLVVK